MKTEPKEPSSLLIAITHREMLSWMADAGVFCSVDKFTRILQEAQRRALADQAKREEAMDQLVALSEEMGGYDLEPTNGQ
ncbi:hypothetical protein AB4Y32_16120 [Paraburkholderia phymatum]|uniref:Uncharacterized protein n=1 Tax=Paraburkholderia phymatum TaxID=148447 RepID=A0ACC6U0T4_9BURK